MMIRRFLAGLIFLGTLAALLSGSCFAAEASAPLSPIPFKHDSSTANEGSRLIVGFGFCAVLLAGAIYLARRRNGFLGKRMAGKRLVQVMETSRLGPKSMLYVVEFGGSRYLLAESANGIHCVAAAPAPDRSSAEQNQ